MFLGILDVYSQTKQPKQVFLSCRPLHRSININFHSLKASLMHSVEHQTKWPNTFFCTTYYNSFQGFIEACTINFGHINSYKKVTSSSRPFQPLDIILCALWAQRTRGDTRRHTAKIQSTIFDQFSKRRSDPNFLSLRNPKIYLKNPTKKRNFKYFLMEGVWSVYFKKSHLFVERNVLHMH